MDREGGKVIQVNYINLCSGTHIYTNDGCESLTDKIEFF